MKHKIFYLLSTLIILSSCTSSSSKSMHDTNFTKDNTKEYLSTGLAAVDKTFCLNPTTFMNSYGGGRSSGHMFTVISACTAQGIIYSGFAHAPYELGYSGNDWWCGGNDCYVVVTLNGGSEAKYKGKLLSAVDNSNIIIEGIKESESAGLQINSGNFNSPFIYFMNQPKGEIKVGIKSEWQEYKSQIPGFNNKNGWLVDSDGKDVSVNSVKKDSLFYELAIKKIELTRNGKNFNSKDELINFLKKSDFYNNLSFTEKQKQDSLGYIIPKINNSSNYYLSILDNGSIENISNLNIFPKPEKLLRKYFAIYPTNSPVKTYGELKYPEIINNNKYTVEENGEIYVSSDMVVLWK